MAVRVQNMFVLLPGRIDVDERPYAREHVVACPTPLGISA
jgi:hypothetical protein